jgi:hypothetical protein
MFGAGGSSNNTLSDLIQLFIGVTSCWVQINDAIIIIIIIIIIINIFIQGVQSVRHCFTLRP